MHCRRLVVGVTFMIWLFFGLEAQAQTRVKAVSGDGIYSLLRRYDIPLSSATINEFIALNKDYIGDNRKIYAGREYWLPQFEVTPRDSIQEASSGEGSLKEATEADTTDRHVKVITPIVKKTVEEQSERSLSPESPSPVSTKGERSIVNSSATKDSVSKSLSDKSVYAGRFPIFGKDHELVLRKDNVLAGCYYYLISGHGGPDPGAVGTISNKKVAEDEYAYDVTLRLARHLISRGAVVYLITRDPDDGIRDDKILPIDYDERCYPSYQIPQGQRARLRQRSNAVNKLYRRRKSAFQQVVSIHVDSRSVGENIDVFFYHSKESESGKRLANSLQDVFREKYERFQPGRGYVGNVQARSLYVLKNTLPTAVFVELGNIRNQADQKRLVLANNREALANWMAQGMVRDFQSRR